MTLYVVYGDTEVTNAVNGVVGVFRNKQDAETVLTTFDRVDLIILEYESKKSDSEYVWLLLSKCNRGCLIDLSDDVAYLAKRQELFLKINRCDDDSLDYLRLKIGIIRDEKTLALHQHAHNLTDD